MRQAASRLVPRLEGSLANLRGTLTARIELWFKRARRADYAVIRDSGLFDPHWYLAQNPDAARFRADPLKHYLSVGVAEGRPPCPLFDPFWYRESYPGVVAAGADPFAHFLRVGRVAGYSPSPFFDTHWYQHRNGPFESGGLNPLVHYVSEGAARRFDPSPSFSTGWYFAEYPDVAAAGFNPLIDYVEHGRWCWHSTHPREPPPGSPVKGFRDLPWSGLHPGQERPIGQRGHFKLLYVLAAQLGEREREAAAGLIQASADHPDFETFVVTIGGAGTIRDIAPTLDLGEASLVDLDPKTVATRIAQAFRDFGPLRAAVLVGGDAQFRAAFDRVGVPSLDDPSAGGSGPERAEVLIAEFRQDPLFAPRRDLSISAVVLPARDRALLEGRLRTIFGQTRPPDEVIVLVDGSDPDLPGLVADYAGAVRIPFTIVPLEPGAVSPFKSLRKGIEKARGDLVWIAQPEDESEPDLLEQIAPLFFDAALTFAYAQSQILEPDGNVYATDYRFRTDPISAERWSRSYRVRGSEEIADALSQANTVPSLGAALFRRSDVAALAPALETFRYAGDWWLCSEAARRGDVAYVSRSLNRHRASATPPSDGYDSPGALAETLRIKAGLFRAVELSLNTIHRSLGESAHDYLLRSQRRGGSTLGFAEHPAALPWLESIRADLDERLDDRGRLRILLVTDDEPALGCLASDRLAGCATPYLVAARIPTDRSEFERQLLLEGTVGRVPWSDAPSTAEHQSTHRIDVLVQLSAFHRIDALVSFGSAGRELAAELAAKARLPWLAVLTRETPLSADVRIGLEQSCDGLIRTSGRIAEALDGDGPARFVEAISQAVEGRRSRTPAPPARSDPVQASR